MNKRKRCLAVLLALLMTVSVSLPAFAADMPAEVQPRRYTIPVISADYPSGYVDIYEINGGSYMRFDDIAMLTRCELNVGVENITLTQGARELVIEKASGFLRDSGIVNQHEIPIYEYNGYFLCEAIPMLEYLGASCEINDFGIFEVAMPMYTLWEAIVPDITDHYIDIQAFFGDKDDIGCRVICDTIVNVLNASGYSLTESFLTDETAQKNALLTMLNVDIMEYPEVQQVAAEVNAKINRTFSSEDLKTVLLDSGKQGYDLSEAVLEYAMMFGEKRYLPAGKPTLKDIVDKIDESISEGLPIKLEPINYEDMSSILNGAMLLLDTTITASSLMQINEDARTLLGRVLNDEILGTVDYVPSWKPSADAVTGLLKDNSSILEETIAAKVGDFVLEWMAGKSAEELVSFFSSSAGLALACLEMSSYLTSLAFGDFMAASAAELNAIYLAIMQVDTCIMVSRLQNYLQSSGGYMNAQELEKLRDMLSLFYRLSIAFLEQYVASFEKDEATANQEYLSTLVSKTDSSGAGFYADKLYRLINCTIVPITFYESGRTIFTEEWLAPYAAVTSSSDVVIDALEDREISSLDGNVQPGDRVIFGTYEQDLFAGPDDIEWIVLHREEDAVLLLSRKVLASTVPWSELRAQVFLKKLYNEGFTPREKERILARDHTVPQGYDTKGIYTSVETVFLLSPEEVWCYLPTVASRQAEATEYAARISFLKSSNTTGSVTVAWWLGKHNSDKRNDCILPDGEYYKDNEMDGLYSIGLRPAMWVSLAVDSKQESGDGPVIECYRWEESVDTSWGKEDRVISIPQITLDSEYAQTVNAANLALWDDAWKGRSEEDGIPVSVEYEYSIRDNILSLVTHTVGFYDNERYYVYLLDMTTGEAVAEDQLLAMAQVSESNVNTLAQNTVKTYLDGLAAQFPDSAAFYNACKNMQEDYDRDSMHFYFGADGELWLTMSITWLAGSGRKIIAARVELG